MVISNAKSSRLSSTIGYERRNQLAEWVISELSEDRYIQETLPLKAIGGQNAGFRKYYRVMDPEGSLIAVDSPPETEDNKSFIDIAKFWNQQGIKVPKVYAIDLERGYLLLEDFGDHLLYDCLREGHEETWYRQSLVLLSQIQMLPSTGLPFYDESLLRDELSLYKQWFLQLLLGSQISSSEDQVINNLFDYLIKAALEQPKVAIHRDFHSRNLMLCADGELGVIDFQGAVYGPILYDLSSILKDCYYSIPTAKVEQLLIEYTHNIPALASFSSSQIIKWFDFVGMQRHFKCLGIFSRLWLRDGRASHLGDLSKTLDYITTTCRKYPEMQNHGLWLEKRIIPQLVGRVKGLREEAGV